VWQRGDYGNRRWSSVIQPLNSYGAEVHANFTTDFGSVKALDELTWREAQAHKRAEISVKISGKLQVVDVNKNVPGAVVRGFGHSGQFPAALFVKRVLSVEIKPNPSYDYGDLLIVQAAGCLECGVVSWRFGVLFAGTEFGGGQLARWNDLGGNLLVLALVGSFIFDRVAAGCALVASFLCLPMCFYFTVPRFLVLVFPCPLKMTPPHAIFIWDGWSITGILAILLTVCICLQRLLITEKTASDGLNSSK
jgi:hypothetical protein